jgi:hypothetical protein
VKDKNERKENKSNKKIFMCEILALRRPCPSHTLMEAVCAHGHGRTFLTPVISGSACLLNGGCNLQRQRVRELPAP